MQFIFLVESDSKSKSDYQYIYASINYFYSFIKGEHKFSPIYMSGKGNYNKFYNKKLCKASVTYLYYKPLHSSL